MAEDAANVNDCAAPDVSHMCRKLYQKIVSRSSRLVEVCERVGRKYGIPVTNRRLAISPIATILAGHGHGAAVQVARTLDAAALDCRVDFVGGLTALVHKGTTPADALVMDSLPEVLAERVAEREEQLAAALARIAELEKQLAAARKDSSTSSKPPSSDIVKPPRASGPARGKGRRKRKPRRGGQPGHDRHERTPFGPEEVDRAWIYEWPESALASGGGWKLALPIFPFFGEPIAHRTPLIIALG